MADQELTLEQIDACLATVRAELSTLVTASALADLAQLLWHRYVVRSGAGEEPDEQELEAAIDALEAARVVSTVDESRRRELTWWAAHAWLEQYGRSENSAHLDRIVRVLEDLLDAGLDDPEVEASARGMLGQAYVVLSAERGAFARDRAIEELAAALSLAGDEAYDIPEPAWWWTAVEAYGSALASRWHAELNADDLDEAIAQLSALSIHNGSIHSGQTQCPAVLAELGKLLHERAALRLAGPTDGDRLAGLADLDAAAAWTARAVEIVEPDDPDLVAIRYAAALAAWEHCRQTRDAAELSHVDGRYRKALAALPADADSRTALAGLRALVRAAADNPQWTQHPHPLLDRRDDPTVRPLLRIKIEHIDEAIRRHDTSRAGDPGRAGLAAMIASAEIGAFRTGRRELDWAATLRRLAEAEQGLPYAADRLRPLWSIARAESARPHAR
jgi:hypothetical protein